MKNSTYKLIVTLLVLTIVIGGGVLLYQRLAGSVSLDMQAQDSEGASQQLAPDFTVVDADGAEHKLSDYRGKPVVVNFWASWCGPCKMEMPHFQSAWETHGEDIQFMMVNMAAGFGDSREKTSKFLTDGNYTFPVFYDDKSESAIAYGLSGVPMTQFIDAEGYIQNVSRGMLSAEKLDAAIQSLLAD